MKTIVVNNYGSIEHVTEMCLNAQVEIGMDNHGEISAKAEFPTGYGTSDTKKITLVKYTGSLNYNGGAKIEGGEPFNMTDGAFKVWKQFLQETKKELLNYVTNK